MGEGTCAWGGKTGIAGSNFTEEVRYEERYSFRQNGDTHGDVLGLLDEGILNSTSAYDLIWVLACSCHSSILSKVGASIRPGEVQRVNGREARVL